MADERRVSTSLVERARLPDGISQRTLTAVVSVALILQGMAVAVYLVVVSNVQPIDFQAFYFAAERALEGEPFVGRSPPPEVQATWPPGASSSWVFPPVVVLYFVPFTLLPASLAWLAQDVLNVVFVALTAGVLLGLRGQTDWNRASRLAFAALLCNPYSVVDLAQGQLNSLVLLLLVGGVVLVASHRETLGGVALGLAAVVKIWPVGVGLWLLWRRDWRAIAAATVTGVSGLLGGVLLFGTPTTRQWLSVVLVERSQMARLVGRISADNDMTTLARPLSVLFPNLDALVALGIAALVVLAGVGYVFRRATPDERPMATAGLTLGATLLVVPAARYPYLLVPLSTGLGLLYRGEPSGRSRWLLAAGAVVCATPMNLADFAAIAPPGLVGFPADVLLKALPPYLLGGVLLVVAHGLLATSGSDAIRGSDVAVGNAEK